MTQRLARAEASDREGGTWRKSYLSSFDLLGLVATRIREGQTTATAHVHRRDEPALSQSFDPAPQTSRTSCDLQLTQLGLFATLAPAQIVDHRLVFKPHQHRRIFDADRLQ
jgi:hypothetical protein